MMKLSDRLLEFLLRGNKQETYRDRGTVELTGKDGGPIEIVERLNRQPTAHRESGAGNVSTSRCG